MNIVRLFLTTLVSLQMFVVGCGKKQTVSSLQNNGIPAVGSVEPNSPAGTASPDPLATPRPKDAGTDTSTLQKNQSTTNQSSGAGGSGQTQNQGQTPQIALSTLSWNGAALLDNQCHVSLSGSLNLVGTDTFVSAAGTFPGFTNVSSSASGIVGDLSVFNAGPVAANWQVTTSRSNVTLTKTGTLIAAPVNQFAPEVAAPTLAGNVAPGLELALVNSNSCQHCTTAARGQIAASDHVCALTPGAGGFENGVACWGRNDVGQVGYLQSSVQTIPTALQGISTAAKVVAGTNHACALLQNGTVKCWGANTHGQLGDGTNTDRLTPVSVTSLSGATDLAAGDESTCALVANGEVRCWGKNSDGQLGAGISVCTNNFTDTLNLTDSNVPVSVLDWGFDYNAHHNSSLQNCGAIPLTGATSLVGGRWHYCVTSPFSGIPGGVAVKCWGSNTDSQMGRYNDTASRESVADVVNAGSDYSWLHDVVSIGAGAQHNCALLEGTPRTVRCWGKNDYGQADPVSSRSGGANLKFDLSREVNLNLTGGVAPVGLASTLGWSSCALLSNGSLKCWGYGGEGQFGDGLASSSNSVVSIPNLTGVAQVAGGPYSFCSVQNDGKIACWGKNNWGQNASGTVSQLSAVQLAPGVSGASWVAQGDNFGCAVASGQVFCWGSRARGRLGDATNGLANVTTPQPVFGLNSGVVSIATGAQHTCALLADKTVKCWGGSGSEALLGDGVYSPLPVPVSVKGLTSAVSITAGESHSCALLQDGTVKCWGRNSEGQQGNGAGVSNSYLQDAGIVGAKAVVAGGAHTCALLQNGTVSCWGANYKKQKGQNATNDDNTGPDNAPYVIPIISNAVALSAGYEHTCALLSTGEVNCWGSQQYGQTGYGGAFNNGTIPRIVVKDDSGSGEHLTGVVAVSAGKSNTCALLNSGNVTCWGSDARGQSAVNSGAVTPVAATGISFTDMVALSQSGGGAYCGLLKSGQVSCWGDGSFGTMGNGTTTQTNATAVDVTLPAGGFTHRTGCANYSLSFP